MANAAGASGAMLLHAVDTQQVAVVHSATTISPTLVVETATAKD